MKFDKNKKIIISVVLISIAVLLFIASLYLKPEMSCGSSFAGKFYDDESCDKSCDLDSDCKFDCGCDAINKNETCFTEGVAISCEQPVEIKCMDNQCVALSEKDICEREGGEWALFNNGCVDSCEYRRNTNQVMCTQALTYGCYCGKEKCWDSEEKTCEDI